MAVKKVQRCTRASLQKPALQMLKNKERQKQATAVNETDRKAVIIAQEIKFARLLSSNDKKVRDKVLKNLRKWLTVRSKSSFAFTEQDFMRLWKGLFYCMWMSDKPLIQEELAESLSKIVHCFNIKDVVLLYTACVLKTLGTEWFGIDQYRLDKFSMLVRRIIRQTFEKCKERSWDPEWIKGISEILEKLLIDPKICLGFNMHLTQLFWEELSKISAGEISEDVVTELVKPFISHFLIMDDERQIRHVMRHIFRYLIFQSDIGMNYMEKFEAWKAAGFPAGTIDAMERIEVSDEEIDDNDVVEEEECPQEQVKHNIEKPLDPRAGRVNVELPQIPFNAKKIAVLLAQYKFHPSSTTKSRRQLRRLINEFTELSQGKMPLGVKEIRLPKTQKKDTDSKRAVVRLFEFEKQLYSDNAQKKRKRKKNGLLTQDENGKLSEEENSDVDDQDCVAEVDEIESTREKKKVQHKVNINNNVTLENSQASDADIPRSKKRKYEMKEKNQNSKTEVKNSNCKSKKDSSLPIKSSSNCKKMKVKKNKAIPEIALSVTPGKRKKTTTIKLSDKWDISDNVVPSMPALLNANSTESRTDTAETDDSTKKSNSFNKGPAWLVPALKKLQNEKLQRTPVSIKQQPKVNNDSNSKKRVKIALQRNTAQRSSEYILQVRKSPSIPFDANRKPLAGVLKASPIPSPINPFYKKNPKCPMN
ncbi:ribosomal RNA processing protein 1 homolog Nnp-1 [Andrena cerasifolii]|uniref:ribosomal RNA processing protein 1 homolog Nnp-1 n=1 Tax=Andrena cerasifolii TaxID=2819439 RepID=UPI0040382932